MEKEKALFIINQKSGNSKNIDIKDLINSKVNKALYEIHQYQLGKNPVEEISGQVDKIKPGVVVAIGGDGTCNLVSSAIKNTLIQLLIVPFGSANGMAKELNMPSEIDQCLDLLNHEKHILPIDMICINGHDSIHLADVGLNARIVKRFQNDKSRGLFTYAKHLFSEMFLLKRYSFLINYDQKVIKRKAVSLTFANSSKYGTGAVINPVGKIDDGKFELCIVKPFPKHQLISIAWKMFANKLQTSAYFEVISCEKAFIRSSKKTTLQIDGEIIGKVKEIDIHIIKHALQVIVPPSAIK